MLTQPAQITFGDYLGLWLAHRNLSQSQAARQLGLEPSYLSRLARNGRQPSRATVVALADLLEISGPKRLYFFSLAGYVEEPLTYPTAVAIADLLDRRPA